MHLHGILTSPPTKTVLLVRRSVDELRVWSEGQSKPGHISDPSLPTGHVLGVMYLEQYARNTEFLRK